VSAPSTAPLRGDRRLERRESRRASIVAEAWRLAHQDGLAAISLRDLADAVGLRQPSLYVYFDSKHAIYDAMFAQGATAAKDQLAFDLSGDLRGDLREAARRFVRFCAEDAARFQLLFTRTIPGFEPTPETFAISIAVYDQMRERMARGGITKQADLDLWTGLMSGLASQQIANDPGGDRWLRLVDDAVDMYIAHVTNKKRGKK